MPWEGRFFVNVLKDIFITVENSLKDKVKEIFSILQISIELHF